MARCSSGTRSRNVGESQAPWGVIGMEGFRQKPGLGVPREGETDVQGGHGSACRSGSRFVT